MEEKVAVIDLGTNTFHLLIADWVGGQYNITYRERVPVKIGQGGINNNVITQAGIERAMHALQKFKVTLTNAGITRVFAFGTSALRSARNGKEVAAMILKETGIQVKIISGDEEAGYIYQGVKKAAKMGDTVSLIVDIGGGSIEFIIGNDQGILWKRSFEIGAQRLLERYQQHDPIMPEETESLNDYFATAIKPLFEAIQEFKPTVMVGSSGTFDTLSDIHCLRLGIPLIPNAPETPLTFDSFWETYAMFLSMNRAERMQIPGMIEMRVDMIVVASCLIAYLLDHWHFDAIRVSSYSLKEGVLATLEKDLSCE